MLNCHIGETFHQLTILEHVGTTTDNHHRPLVKVACCCGAIKVLRLENVIRRKEPTKSCGCVWGVYTGIQSIAYGVYAENYKDGDLTFDQFEHLAQQDCFYCNKPPSNIRKGRNKIQLTYTYNGLDRIDHNQPHNEDNLVTACWPCNNKRSNMSFTDFLEWIQAVYLNRIAS
jgi:5-methylcytosine-specific restriction endonuclease McrA